MPTIGGVTIRWDEAKPAGGDSLSIGDDEVRSTKTALRNAIAAEHIMDAAGGANSGAHVFGSARPYYGAQSLVSSTGSDGRLMQTSDSSRLFGVGSGGTVFLGGPTVISAGSYPGSVPQRAHWAMEFGTTDSDSGGTVTVTWPNSGFSTAPYVVATAYDDGDVSPRGRIADVFTQSVTGAVIRLSTHTGAVVSLGAVNWFAMGRRAL